MAIKYIDEIAVQGKRVFIRADFNVPLDASCAITNDNRIRETVPTLRHVLDNGGAIILASHLGRPKAKVVKEMSLRPVARRLSELLGLEVQFAEPMSEQAVIR